VSRRGCLDGSERRNVIGTCGNTKSIFGYGKIYVKLLFSEQFCAFCMR
jgi:hypothetical protein